MFLEILQNSQDSIVSKNRSIVHFYGWRVWRVTKLVIFCGRHKCMTPRSDTLNIESFSKKGNNIAGVYEKTQVRENPNSGIFYTVLNYFYLFSIYFTLTIKIKYILVYLYITIAKHKMSAN